MKKIVCSFDVCPHLQIQFSVLSKLFTLHKKFVLYNSASTLLILLLCTNVFPSGKNPDLPGAHVFPKTMGSKLKHYPFFCSFQHEAPYCSFFFSILLKSFHREHLVMKYTEDDKTGNFILHR